MCTYLNKTNATYYFRRPVPDDLAGYFTTKTGKPRTEWKFSLGTKDRETAKRLLRPHEVETDKLIDDARLARSLSTPSSPEEEAEWQREREEQAAAHTLAEESRMRRDARSDLRMAWRIRRRTSTAMLRPEEAAAVDLLREQDAEIAKLRDALAVMERGNQRLGITALASDEEMPQSGSALALGALYERYVQSGAANPKTARKWRSRVESLIEHLGHDDASIVTRADLNGWTAALIAKGLAKKTVVDGYLPAVRAAFGIAYDDGAIRTNPAAGLKVRGPKAVKLREREHSDEEAATILKAALDPQPERLADHHARARRWVPWLCAYTGARVGELTQLRAMDIQQEGGIWYLHLTPEAGSIKTNEARKVPLHSHLIEQGFTDLAKAGDATPLFHREGAGNDINPASKVRAADLAKWIKTLGVETPQPNHGWRHRFKTMCRVAEIPEHLMDALQGHAPRHEGGKYGSNPLVTLRDAVEKLPRFKV